MFSERFRLDPRAFCEELILNVGRVADALWKEPLFERGETTAWTTAVKQFLKQIGEQHKYDCLYSLSGHDCSEFILDFVWWYRGAEGEIAVLGCESEFLQSEDEVSKDFDKLLSFKASVKMMIFATREDKPSLQTQIIERLTKHAALYGFHLQGEIYLLVDLCPTSRAWILEISRNGFIPDLQFKKLI